MDNDISKAIIMLQNQPLNGNQLSKSPLFMNGHGGQSKGSFLENKSQSNNYQVLTTDSEGAIVQIKPEDLTRLFCLTQSQLKMDPLLSPGHSDTISDYVNDQIVQHLKALKCSDVPKHGQLPNML